MKNIYKYSLALLAAVGFTACGGSDSSFEDTPAQAVILGIGESIEVNTGDSVTPLSDETNINVTHSINNDTKVVTVLNGEISYLAGNYTINQ